MLLRKQSLQGQITCVGESLREVGDYARFDGALISVAHGNLLLMMLWSLIRGCSEPRSLERRRCKCSPDDLRDRFQRICSSDACAQPLSLFPITRIIDRKSV